MRNAPFRLAIFGISITVLRIAMFVLVIDSGYGAFWGRVFAGAFALLVAFGVYISSYAIRYRQSRWPGIAGVVLFGLGDLWFNESAVIYNTSSAQIVAPDSNFMGISAEILRYGMQFSALVFGAFPTLAAAVLGWMQAGIENVAVLKSRNWFGQIGIVIAAKVNSMFPETTDTAKRLPQNSEYGVETSAIRDGKLLPAKAARWENLTAGQKAEIAGMLPTQIITRYGGSERRARMWKEWIRNGK